MTEPTHPSNVTFERLVLGALLTDEDAIGPVTAMLDGADFSLEKHRRIYTAIKAIHESGERPDHYTVAVHLKASGKLESVDGISYLVELDDGMPALMNVENYCRQLRESATRRLIMQNCQEISERASLGMASIAELTDALQNAHRRAVDGALCDDGLLTLSEYLNRVPGGPAAFLEAESEVNLIPMPWQRLTEALGGGLRPGELVILAARPGLGKSAAAGQMALAAAQAERSAVVFSLEMENRQIWQRMFANVGRVSLQRFRRGKLDLDERDRVRSAMTYLLGFENLRISDRPHRTMAAIERVLRREAARRPVNLVLIDYLQLLQLAKRPRSRVEEMTEITRTLKLMAKEFAATFVVMAQLNRESVKENREPRLDDLRESGSIEQDADIVIFIYQKPSDKERSIRERTNCPTELIMAKQRQGPLAKVPTMFNARFVQFEEEIQCQDSGRFPD